MDEEQAKKEIEYLIARGLPPPIEGVLCVLMGAIYSGMVPQLLHFLTPFSKQAIQEIRNAKHKLN